MTVYNPNDELRAIVQRKQHEVKTLLAQHSASDDPLQASEECIRPLGRSMSRSSICAGPLRGSFLDQKHVTS